MRGNARQVRGARDEVLPRVDAFASIGVSGRSPVTGSSDYAVGASVTVNVFQSFKTPLTIMAAIPFSLIGILPAHALMGAFFTATLVEPLILPPESREEGVAPSDEPLAVPAESVPVVEAADTEPATWNGRRTGAGLGPRPETADAANGIVDDESPDGTDTA